MKRILLSLTLLIACMTHLEAHGADISSKRMEIIYPFTIEDARRLVTEMEDFEFLPFIEHSLEYWEKNQADDHGMTCFNFVVSQVWFYGYLSGILSDQNREILEILDFHTCWGEG